MSLNYNVGKIFDRQTLHSNDAEWAITETLIWATMQIGLGSITKTNVELFATRLHLYQEIFGPLMSKAGGGIRVTTADVQRRVGLSTNADTLTAPAFKNRCWDRKAQAALQNVRLDLKELDPAQVIA